MSQPSIVIIVAQIIQIFLFSFEELGVRIREKLLLYRKSERIRSLEDF